MTTIAFDGKTLAADGGMVVGGVKVRYKNKLRRLKSGGLAGFAGDIAGGQALLDWLAAGRFDMELLIPEDADADALWVRPDGAITLCDTDGTLIEVAERVMAIGSGADIAFGALLAGATAEEAVRLCIEHDPGSGFDVISLRL